MADIVYYTLEELIDRYRTESKLNATNFKYLYVDHDNWKNVFSTDNIERCRRGAVGRRYIIRSEEELISLLAMLEL